MTEERKKYSDYRLLILIVAQKLDEKAQEVFARKKLSVQYHIYAKGTASGEFADMFGLGGVDKTTLACPLPKSKADEMLVTLREELYLGAPNTGVAFTVPLSGGSLGLIRWLDSMSEEENSEGEGTMDGKYTVIMAFVNQGFSEEVMAAAKTAGAGGGTVFHSRRVDNEEAHHYWGVSFQEEREVVLILAKKENKSAIMKAIGESCGLQSEAMGIVVSLPVDDVAGLRKDEG